MAPLTEFKFHCPQCARRLRIDVQLAGSQIRCPACEKIIPVPFPGDQPLAEGRPLESGSDNALTDQGAPGHRARTLIYWRRAQPPQLCLEARVQATRLRRDGGLIRAGGGFNRSLNFRFVPALRQIISNKCDVKQGFRRQWAAVRPCSTAPPPLCCHRSVASR